MACVCVYTVSVRPSARAACLPGCLLGHRRILWEFPVEFNYTLCLVSYAVVLTYSVAFPSITLIGWFFGVLRHWTDRYTLLFAHQGNLDRHFADEDDEAGLCPSSPHSAGSQDAKSHVTPSSSAATIVECHVCVTSVIVPLKYGESKRYPVCSLSSM